MMQPDLSPAALDGPGSVSLTERIAGHLRLLYPDSETSALVDALVDAAGLQRGVGQQVRSPWDERDVALITYGDSVLARDEHPLGTLRRFLAEYFDGVASVVHLLPFFPYSSDDGFAVIDYRAVNPALGDWDDIRALAGEFRLMADLVINHASAQSEWFQGFVRGDEPYRDYFVTADPAWNLDEVVRPRTSPLLRSTMTADGLRWVWSTFSSDQVDLDFRNPTVLLEFARILRFYLECGVRIFRLDAIAYLWKEPGTPCVHLPQTHEVVKLLRTLLEANADDAVIVTETNVPQQENLAYFGNGNEAHLVYNFALPPLLVHMLLTGDCRHFKAWLLHTPAAQEGTAYLNFIASHDGIGLRPSEGLLGDSEWNSLIELTAAAGGQVNWRAQPGGGEQPYELNVSLWDLMAATLHGRDSFQLERFLCAHAIMLALAGLPAIYLHSFLGTGNDLRRVARTGQARAINRHQWQLDELESALASDTHHAEVLRRMCRLVAQRRAQPAFHPNAAQYVLHLPAGVLGFWRLSADHDQAIYCLFNISGRPRRVDTTDLNLPSDRGWCDLIGDSQLAVGQRQIELAPYQAMWLSHIEGEG